MKLLFARKDGSPHLTLFEQVKEKYKDQLISEIDHLAPTLFWEEGSIVLIDLNSFSFHDLQKITNLNKLEWLAVSNNKEGAYSALKFGAKNFWLIPDEEELFFKELKDCFVEENLSDLPEKSNDKLELKTISNKKVRIPSQNIIYIEANADLAYVHFTNEHKNLKRIAVAQNLKHLSLQLGEQLFFRAHRKYLVGRKFILPFGNYPSDSIGIKYLNEPIPLARRRKLAFNNWFKHIPTQRK